MQSALLTTRFRALGVGTLMFLLVLSLTGCCGSGTNSTTTTTNNGGGGGGGTPTPTNRPVFIVVTPSGKFAFVADAGMSSIYQYSIGTNGALTPLAPAMVTSNISKPNAIAISDDSQYAYVANQGNNTIASFKIGTTGALTPLSQATVSIKGTPSRLVAGVGFNISNFLYVGHTSGIARFQRNADGSLTSLGADAAVGPVTDLIKSGSGAEYYLHILNASTQTVTDAAVNADGSLNVFPKGYSTGKQPAALVNSEAGIFALNQGDNSISSFPEEDDQISGAAVTIKSTSLSAPVAGNEIEGDPDYLLVTNSGSNTVSVFYYFNSSSLTQQSTAATGVSPAWIASTPQTVSGLPYSGEYVYVANQDGTVSQYTFSSSGALTPLSPASVKA